MDASYAPRPETGLRCIDECSIEGSDVRPDTQRALNVNVIGVAPRKGGHIVEQTDRSRIA